MFLNTDYWFLLIQKSFHFYISEVKWTFDVVICHWYSPTEAVHCNSDSYSLNAHQTCTAILDLDWDTLILISIQHLSNYFRFQCISFETVDYGISETPLYALELSRCGYTYFSFFCFSWSSFYLLQRPEAKENKRTIRWERLSWILS